MRAEALGGTVQFRVPSGMREAIIAAADQDGQGPSKWLRDVVAETLAKRGVQHGTPRHQPDVLRALQTGERLVPSMRSRPAKNTRQWPSVWRHGLTSAQSSVADQPADRLDDVLPLDRDGSGSW